MAFVRQLQHFHIDAIVAGTPAVHLGTTETVVVILDFVRRRTAVMVDPHVQSRLHATEANQIVSRTVDV